MQGGAVAIAAIGLRTPLVSPSHNRLYAEAIFMKKLGKTIVSALQTGGSLATSVRYFYVLGFVPGLGADPCPLVKVHEGVPSVWTHPLFVTCS